MFLEDEHSKSKENILWNSGKSNISTSNSSGEQDYNLDKATPMYL